MRIALLAVFAFITASSAQAQDGPRIFYPSLAQEQGIGGRATVECLVQEDGRTACEVTEETPAGMGFGAAALRMSEDWRIAPRTQAGDSTTGGRIRRTLVFEPGPPPSVVTEQPYRWEEQPNAQDFARNYPRGALRRHIDGRVTLSCVVNDDYRLDCQVESEDPAGMGFGAATLVIAQKFRIAAQTSAGESTIGMSVRRTIVWQAP